MIFEENTSRETADGSVAYLFKKLFVYESLYSPSRLETVKLERRNVQKPEYGAEVWEVHEYRPYE